MKLVTAIWLGMMGWLGAAVAGPGEVALGFLEKVRAGEVSSEPGRDTALSPTTGGRKREEIERRWERLARDLGREGLQVGAVRQEGELAAVIVRTAGGLDPARMQVIPVALVRRGEGWLPAPVPASFENTGVGYGRGMRERLEGLEDWMLRQRRAEFEAMRREAVAGLRRRIEQELREDELRGMSSLAAGERFLAACERRRTGEVLGLLGGLAAVPPADWAERLRAAEAALESGVEVAGPWRALVSPAVLRAVVAHREEQDGRSARLVLAVLDPERVKRGGRSGEGMWLVNVVISRDESGGLWRVDLPKEFLVARGEVDEEEGEDGEDGEDSEDGEAGVVAEAGLLDLFPAKLAARYPAVAEAGAAACRDALLAGLQGGSPGAWLRLVNWSGGAAEQRRVMGVAAGLWGEVRRGGGTRRLLVMDFTEDGDAAAVACQMFDARHPDLTDVRVFFFQRGPGGWLWNPGFVAEEHAGLGDWIRERMGRWREGWQEVLASEVPEVAEGVMVPPTAAEARKVIEDWLGCLRVGDVAAALRLCARLDRADSIQTMWRNLGYEITGSRRPGWQPQIGEVRVGQRMAAVAAASAVDGKTVSAWYPVAGTREGPRVLIEIDLIAAGSRSRDFLNRASLDRLREARGPEAAGDLEEALGGSAGRR